MKTQILINGLFGGMAVFIVTLIWKEHPLLAMSSYALFIFGIINSLIARDT